MLTRAQHGREKYPPLPPCLFSNAPCTNGCNANLGNGLNEEATWRALAPKGHTLTMQRVNSLRIVFQSNSWHLRILGCGVMESEFFGTQYRNWEEVT